MHSKASIEIHMDARIILCRWQRADQLCRLHAKTQVTERYPSRTLLLPERERKHCTDSASGLGRTTPYHEGRVKVHSGNSGQLLSVHNGTGYYRKTHEEVMEAFANNWTYRIGALDPRLRQWIRNPCSTMDVPSLQHKAHTNTNIQPKIQCTNKETIPDYQTTAARRDKRDGARDMEPMVRGDYVCH